MVYATANLPVGREISIDAPSDRVTGTENISVSYNFPYAADSCYNSGNHTDPCKTRSVSVYVGSTNVFIQGGNQGLPLSGAINVPFDFSRISGTTIIKASACCGGHCRTVEKLVYKDPEDDGCNVKAGKPVSVANGNVFLGETDFPLSGVMPANFKRYYFSKGIIMTGLGQMWSHTFDTRIIGFGGNTYKAINPDGSIVYYIDNDRDKIYDVALPKGERSKLIKNPNNTFVREFFDGTKEEFNAAGYLTAMVDRNGNRITLARGTNNALTKITDPAGREINITNNTSNKITSITLPDGKVFSYTYVSGTGFLGKVTYPDGSMKNYEYVYKVRVAWNRLEAFRNKERKRQLYRKTYL